jgi:hypothetical protein
MPIGDQVRLVMSDVGRAVRARLSTKAAMINSSIATGPKVRHIDCFNDPAKANGIVAVRGAPVWPNATAAAMTVPAQDKVPMK